MPLRSWPVTASAAAAQGRPQYKEREDIRAELRGRPPIRRVRANTKCVLLDARFSKNEPDLKK